MSAANPIAFTPLLTLTKRLHDARNRAEAQAKVTHERFNVFTTLLSAHDEVRLHTRFIHNLLNPDGTHDCGTLFLDLFLATLEEKSALDHAGEPMTWKPIPKAAKWGVQKEASVKEGQIDLLLETTGCGIAIENKIYAGEQLDQLTRYSRYLIRRHDQDSRLLFLTLDGRQATTHGTASYYRISYSEHILAWLEKCLRETFRFIPINQVLLQYREVVRQLTGQTLDTALMKTVTDFIIENPDIIRYRQQIAAGIWGARVAFMEKLAEGIINGMGEGFRVRLRPDLGQKSFGSHDNGALIITPPSSSPLHDAPFEIWVEHISKWNGVVVGVESKFGKPPLTEAQRHLLNRMDQLLRAPEFMDYHKANPHVLWDGTEWPTGWHNLIQHPIDDERLATLIETPIKETVAFVCEGIRIHIALIERVYEQARSELAPINEAAQVSHN